MSGISSASPSASWSFFSSLDEPGNPAVLGPAAVLGSAVVGGPTALLFGPAELLGSALELGSAVVLGPVEAFDAWPEALGTEESSLFPCVDLNDNRR